LPGAAWNVTTSRTAQVEFAICRQRHTLFETRDGNNDLLG
jgi:hypothetical protein